MEASKTNQTRVYSSNTYPVRCCAGIVSRFFDANGLGRDTTVTDLVPRPIIRSQEVEPERNSYHMRHLDSHRRCLTLLFLPSSYPLFPSIFPLAQLSTLCQQYLFLTCSYCILEVVISSRSMLV